MNALQKYGLLACCALACNGCSSIMSHTGAHEGYYHGTRASAQMLTAEDSSWAMRPLAAIDLPFSAVMDTLLLPWDYYRANDDKSLKSPRERILRSERMMHTQESLAQTAPDAASPPLR